MVHPIWIVMTGAFAGALRYFFGVKKVHITLTSTVTNTAHTFGNTDGILTEIVNARVYGGMYYRASAEDGVTIGKTVAQWVAKYYFRPVTQGTE
jgi:uncharacterized protein with LGFP repeats